MTVHLSDAILAKAFPTMPADRRKMVLTAIGPTLLRYEINTAKKIAAFLGQTAHESAVFKTTVENLNYSASGLRATFPKYFTNDTIAAKYARNPRAIASRAYASRMGNGPEATGEGWAYRGRSYIQISGKDNYVRFALAHKMTLADAVAYLETPEGAFMGAGWFWSTNRLNVLADGWEITKISRAVNGGNNGLADRVAKSNAVLKVLEARS